MREDIYYLPHYDFLFKPGEHLEEGCHDVPGHVLRLEPGVAEAEEHEAVLSVLDEVGDVQGQRVGGLWWCTVIMILVVSITATNDLSVEKRRAFSCLKAPTSASTFNTRLVSIHEIWTPTQLS